MINNYELKQLVGNICLKISYRGNNQRKSTFYCKTSKYIPLPVLYVIDNPHVPAVTQTHTHVKKYAVTIIKVNRL